jgi:hypothetical protein
MERKYHSISYTSQYFSKTLYSLVEKGSLSFNQLSKKDHTPYNKAVEKSQPKSIGHGRGGDDAE